MSKSPWRSMRTAPKDQRIGVCFDPTFACSWQVSDPLTQVEWFDDETCWWNGGCHRYQAEDFIGWVPLPEGVNSARRYS